MKLSLFDLLSKNVIFTVVYIIVLIIAVSSSCFSFSARRSPMYIVTPSDCNSALFSNVSSYREGIWYLITSRSNLVKFSKLYVDLSIVIPSLKK